jgi:hypothetical protein
MTPIPSPQYGYPILFHKLVLHYFPFPYALPARSGEVLLKIYPISKKKTRKFIQLGIKGLDVSDKYGMRYKKE